MKNFTQPLKTPIFLFALFIAPSVFAQSVANYDVSITTIWNTTDHTSVPGNAHWSDLIGATHNTENEYNFSVDGCAKSRLVYCSK